MRGPGANVKTRYALEALIYVAGQEEARVTPVSEIAAAVGISPKFLEDILGALRTAGILRSRRGKEGGYQLVPTPAELSVLRVVQALEGPAASSPGEDRGPIAQVAAHAFAQALEAAMAVLAALTLDQLVEGARQIEAAGSAAYMYYL